MIIDGCHENNDYNDDAAAAQPVPGPGLGDSAAPAQHRHLPPHRALHCAEHLQVLELETKVHTKVNNHLEGPY